MTIEVKITLKISFFLLYFWITFKNELIIYKEKTKQSHVCTWLRHALTLRPILKSKCYCKNEFIYIRDFETVKENSPSGSFRCKSSRLRRNNTLLLVFLTVQTSNKSKSTSLKVSFNVQGQIKTDALKNDNTNKTEIHYFFSRVWIAPIAHGTPGRDPLV